MSLVDKMWNFLWKNILPKGGYTQTQRNIIRDKINELLKFIIDELKKDCPNRDYCHTYCGINPA